MRRLAAEQTVASERAKLDDQAEEIEQEADQIEGLEGVRIYMVGAQGIEPWTSPV